MHNGEQTHRVCLFYQHVNLSTYREGRPAFVAAVIKLQPQIIIIIIIFISGQKKMQLSSSADSLPPHEPGFVVSNHFKAS